MSIKIAIQLGKLIIEDDSTSRLSIEDTKVSADCIVFFTLLAILSLGNATISQP
ncbi:hypothetical protein [Pleurocapsa sp. FMAR1]|uniref:hypothetical protein n=1 Tax=Pleurocapsa sp. FMAR1 TaxID=3040204 RepID=UPI0029C93A70|nr:hypothetical protein [Pleurocapsa sp. FMAR1]